MLTGIKIDNFTAFEQLDIRVGQLRVEYPGQFREDSPA